MNFKFQKKSLNTIKKFKNLKMKILKELKKILIQILLLKKLMNDESIFFKKIEFVIYFY